MDQRVGRKGRAREQVGRKIPNFVLPYLEPSTRAPGLKSATRASEFDGALQDTTNQLRDRSASVQAGPSSVIKFVHDILEALASLQASDPKHEIQAWRQQPGVETEGEISEQRPDVDWHSLTASALVGFVKFKLGRLGPLIPHHLETPLRKAALTVDSVANVVSALTQERRLLVMQLLQRMQSMAVFEDRYAGSVQALARDVLVPLFFGKAGQADLPLQLKAAFMIITAGEISAVLNAGNDEVSYPQNPFRKKEDL